MLLLLRFFTFFFKIQKVVTFYVFFAVSRTFPRTMPILCWRGRKTSLNPIHDWLITKHLVEINCHCCTLLPAYGFLLTSLYIYTCGNFDTVFKIFAFEENRDLETWVRGHWTRKPSCRWQTRATLKPAEIASIRRAYNVVVDNTGLSSCV